MILTKGFKMRWKNKQQQEQNVELIEIEAGKELGVSMKYSYDFVGVSAQRWDLSWVPSTKKRKKMHLFFQHGVEIRTKYEEVDLDGVTLGDGLDWGHSF